MHQLLDQFPDPQVLIELPAEELAMKLLPLLAEQNCQNLASAARDVAAAARTRHFGSVSDLEQSFVEAWVWLEAQALLVPTTDVVGSANRQLSRRALQIVKEGNFQDYLSSKLLARELIHASIRNAVWLDFVRGDYDVAVLRSMKQVEIAVREVGGYSAGDYGTDMMNRAFNTEKGPLTDMTAQDAERTARRNLFAGVIGSYKNPLSHRNVDLRDPIEAIEQILLASHLLRIVDGRVAARSATGQPPVDAMHASPHKDIDQ